jgi:hypothetical protein
MKIKCPVCDEYLDNLNQLEEHLSVSVYNKKFLINSYMNLVKKIHEKIEELEKSTVTDQSIRPDVPVRKIHSIIIQELKSLLENDDKK